MQHQREDTGQDGLSIRHGSVSRQKTLISLLFVYCLPFPHCHFRLRSLLALGVGEVLLSVRGYQLAVG